MRAAILSIGSELLHGFLTDTNATHLAQELNALGVELTGVFQVGDNLERIITTFRRALDDADLVVATGGIGPTEDDLTREAVAAVLGEQVRVDASLVDGIRRYFAARGMEMPGQNVKQAWLIPSAESLDNPMGTAPGWLVRHDGQLIVLMPGVPREMYRMWQEQALPRILDRLPGNVIVARTLKTIGIGESAVEQEIIDIIQRGMPTVATYAKDDGVHIRITAVCDDRRQAEQMVGRTDAEIRVRVGRYVYGYLDDSLASAILSPIAVAGARLAIWEAGNAGRLAAVLEDDPIADATIAEARTTSFGAALRQMGAADDPVAVAEACARAAAEHAATDYGAAVAVRLTESDSRDRTRGEIGIAVLHPDDIVSRFHTVTAIAPEIRRRATLWACDFLWSSIQDATIRRPD